MAKIGIINFHKADNYGSVLLAYAIIKALKALGYEAEIINYQPKKQLSMYTIPITTGKGRIKIILEKICWLPYMKDLRKKVRRFDDFRKKYIPMTSYTNKAEDINNVCGTFDITMAAGDQIWNPRCNEFEWCYYLDFVKSGKKIAYAPSMGGTVRNKMSEDTYNLIKGFVSGFDAVSVRDSNVNIVLDEDYPVTLDPTMLLSSDEWKNVSGNKALVEEEYVFYYDPFDLDDDLLHAKNYSNEMACKLVTCNIYYIFRADKNAFDYHLDAGPVEFLNYVRFAKACIGRSFHLAAFSILFEKELLIIGGMNDKRIRELMLKMFKGVEPVLYSDGDNVRIRKDAYNNTFHKNLSEERNLSIAFLKRVLN